jgi:3',5'-cyclic AMP phosphodiesterase CpdA
VNTEITYDTGSFQYKWLVQDLESPAAQGAAFRVVFWHRPPFSSGSGHGSEMETQKTLVPLMKTYGVDIVFNGHDHIYERTKLIDGTTYIVTGGGGAPLYNFKSWNEWTAYKEKAYHFCLVSINGLTMNVRMIRDDGTQGDSTTITSRSAATKDPGIR